MDALVVIQELQRVDSYRWNHCHHLRLQRLHQSYHHRRLSSQPSQAAAGVDIDFLRGQAYRLQNLTPNHLRVPIRHRGGRLCELPKQDRLPVAAYPIC
jgi:hypothetical protein